MSKIIDWENKIGYGIQMTYDVWFFPGYATMSEQLFLYVYVM